MNNKYAILALVFIGLALFFNNSAAKQQVQEIKLGSGKTALAIIDKSLPIISMRIAFKNAGYAHDPDDKSGLAQFISGTINEGAGQYNWLEFTEELKNNSISLNYSAGLDNFYISLKCHSEDFDKAMELLSLSLLEPTFGNEEIEKVKEQFYSIIKEKKNDIGDLAYQNWKEDFYSSNNISNNISQGGEQASAHPYAKKEFGTIEGIKSITKNDLKNYIANNFAQNNFYISVVGDIDRQKFTHSVGKMLAKLPKKQQFGNIMGVFGHKNGLVAHYFERPQSKIFFSTKAVKRNHPDFYPIYIANHILGGGTFQSRLYKRVRKELGLSYSVYSMVDFSQAGSVIIGSAATDHKKAGKTIAEIKNIIANFHKKGISNNDLTATKKYLIGSFPIRLDTNSKLASFLLGMQIYSLDKDFIYKRQQVIENISSKQVNAAIEKYFNPDQFLFSITGKKL